MDLFEFTEETALSSECGCPYDGMAFDGCSYYFLIPCMKKVVKTDLCYTPTDCFETMREYSCICYDSKECCFWAASRNCCNKIFKLSGCLQEIDCIPICGCKAAAGVVTGISYDCCGDTLLVAFTGCVVELDKRREDAVLKYKSSSLWITGVCCCSPYYIISAVEDHSQCLILLNAENQPLCRATMPWCHMLKSVLFNPCHKDCKGYRFDLLVNKEGCYPHVIHAALNPRKIEFHPCQCNDFICKKCCDEPPRKPGDACTDVIESVALMEAALSHILNAEGEKLQKVLASTSDIGQIMCVNKEINRTIINATQLEQALYAKLSAVLECHDCARLCEAECPDGHI
ncbi:MAG: hypothetical protein RR216_03055 [Pseudoflavonifractor sp.]